MVLKYEYNSLGYFQIKDEYGNLVGKVRPKSNGGFYFRQVKDVNPMHFTPRGMRQIADLIDGIEEMVNSGTWGQNG